jgi:EmrB/QacA subfamily drug resistance transporter
VTHAQRLSLLAAIMGSFVAGLDATAVNVALPAIEEDLGGGLAGQQWVSNAYLLALGSLILVGGSLGDVFGERRVFSIGVAGFGVTSLLCALAPSIEVLVVGRALQGVFGALLTPSALAVIVGAFPPAERGMAIGSWTAWSGIATVIGPLVGGWLVDVSSWRWIFAINVPFVALTLAAVMIGVPARAARDRTRRVDWLGAVLCAVGLAGPVYGLIQQPQHGWGSPQVVVPIVAGVALLAAFLAWERRAPDPMLKLDLFRRRNFAVGNLQTLSMYGGLSIVFFLLVIFLQQVGGYSALEAGLATMPATLVLFALSKRAGRLADRYGPRPFMGFGPIVAAVGVALLLLIDSDVDYVTEVLPGLFVFSVGLSATVAPLTATVLADADEDNAGIASGINNAIARVAGLLAIAAIGAVIASAFSSSMDERAAGLELSPAAERALATAKERALTIPDVRGLPPDDRAVVEDIARDAAVSAFHVAIGLSAGLVALGGVLALVGLREPRRSVRCEDCAGGQLAGQPADVGRERLPVLTLPPTAPAARQQPA